MPALTSWTSGQLTLLGDESRPGGVAFCFTERGGGVSEGPYTSLNLGHLVGDEPQNVVENTRRVLAALGAEEAQELLLRPKQVHGDHVVELNSSILEEVGRAQREAEEGADAVVVTAAGVPAMIVVADCAPVVVCGPGGFALVHSGRVGTGLGIAGKAARMLVESLACDTSELVAYVGPHVSKEDYEVGEALVEQMAKIWGDGVRVDGLPANLDFGSAIRASLERAGLAAENIVEAGVSTLSNRDRFFSHRGGDKGRFCVAAWIPGE